MAAGGMKAPAPRKKRKPLHANVLLDLKTFAACDDLWGGPPGPRPAPWSARFWLRLCCSAGQFRMRTLHLCRTPAVDKPEACPTTPTGSRRALELPFVIEAIMISSGLVCAGFTPVASGATLPPWKP